MLLNILFFVIDGFVRLFSNLFPVEGGVVLHLPFGIDDALVSIVGTWNAFLVTFPYADIAWTMFIYFILPFELGMLLLKIILGSRTPSNVN